MESFSELIESLIDELQDYKSSPNTLFSNAISERLDLSLQRYFSELSESSNRLEKYTSRGNLNFLVRRL